MVTTNPIISSTKNVRFLHGGQLLLSPIKKLHFYLECLEKIVSVPSPFNDF